MKKKSFGFGKFILIIVCSLCICAFAFNYAQQKLYFNKFNKLNKEVTELEAINNEFNTNAEKARMFAKTKGLEFVIGSIVLPENYLQDCKAQIESSCKTIQDSCYIDESKIKQTEKDLKSFKYVYKIFNNNDILRELDENLINRANRAIIDAKDNNKNRENLISECIAIFNRYSDMYQEFIKAKEDADALAKVGTEKLKLIEERIIEDSLLRNIAEPLDTIN